MIVLANVLRVVLASLWTGIVGTPLVVYIYLRYFYAQVLSLLGHRERSDHVIEGNAWWAGWVAQRLWSGVLLSLCSVRLRVREAVPVDWSRAHVLCANHASVFDILAIVRVVPPPFRFVAKRELVKWPIIGWSLRPAGQIIVDRGNRSSAVRSIHDAAGRHIRGQVIFFVEGTRTRTGELLPFKKGAFHFAVDNRLPALPVAISGSFAALAKAPWWRLQPGREITLSFLRPIPPPDASMDDAAAVDTLLTQTRHEIAVALDAAA